MTRPDFTRTLHPAEDRGPIEVAAWAGEDCISLDGRVIRLVDALTLADTLRDAVRVAGSTADSLDVVLEMVAEQERLRAVLAATDRPEPGLRVVAP